MHPSDAVLLALCHGELPPGQSVYLVRHASACRACARRLEVVRRNDAYVATLLESLDLATVPALAVPRPVARRSAWRRQLATAAVIVFVVSGVALALPGSPVRRLLQMVIRRPSPAVTRLAPAPLAAPRERVSGISVGAAPSAEIVFSVEQTSGEVRLVVSDTGALTVSAIGGDVGYRVGNDQLIVDNRVPAARYVVTVPRALRRLVLRVAARRLLEIRDGHLLTRDGVPTSLPRTIPFNPEPGKTP